MGGFLLGAEPRLAVTPHIAASWRSDSGALVALQDACSVLPAVNKLGVGAYNQTSALFGFGSDWLSVQVGPSFSAYSVPSCGVRLCGRVVGVAGGGRANVELYFAGPLGLSASMSLDWVGGRSLVLPGGLAGMLVAGPVLRWRSK